MAERLIHVKSLQNEGYEDDSTEHFVEKLEPSKDLSPKEVEGPENNLIICVFVAAFDTKHGNTIEWQFPADVDLTHVEFKSIVSGAHTVAEDFVYFSHQGCYGLSCFAWKSVKNVAERGARMKATGIICKNYTSLHEHMGFLEEQVRQLLDFPGNYQSMKQYYDQYKHCPQRNNFVVEKDLDPCSLFCVENIPVLQITHPAGCFSQFVKLFADKVFILWKMILLQKSIMFYAPPPAGIAGYRVYCTCLLASHAAPFVSGLKPMPLFYVNISDISRLENTKYYVSYTTEKIFETKDHIYDVYVDVQNINCQARLSAMNSVNAADRARYKDLNDYSQKQLLAGEDVTDDEKVFTRFFIEQNHRIFKTLIEVSSREDRSLTLRDVATMGLDPRADRFFIADLVELYNFNIFLTTDCC